MRECWVVFCWAIGDVLVVGPGSAKLELTKHAHRHDSKIAEKSWV